jgi:hypothetical protein
VPHQHYEFVVSPDFIKDGLAVSKIIRQRGVHLSECEMGKGRDDFLRGLSMDFRVCVDIANPHARTDDVRSVLATAVLANFYVLEACCSHFSILLEKGGPGQSLSLADSPVTSGTVSTMATIER